MFGKGTDINHSIREVTERGNQPHRPAYGTELEKQNYKVFLSTKVPKPQTENIKKARNSENVQKMLDGVRPNEEFEIATKDHSTAYLNVQRNTRPRDLLVKLEEDNLKKTAAEADRLTCKW